MAHPGFLRWCFAAPAPTRNRNPVNRRLDHEKLEVYQASLAFISWLDPTRQPWPKGLAVADQLDRASTSIPLNMAEGNGRFTGPDRGRFFDHCPWVSLGKRRRPGRFGGQRPMCSAGHSAREGSVVEDRFEAGRLEESQFRRPTARTKHALRLGVGLRVGSAPKKSSKCPLQMPFQSMVLRCFRWNESHLTVGRAIPEGCRNVAGGRAPATPPVRGRSEGAPLRQRFLVGR